MDFMLGATGTRSSLDGGLASWVFAICFGVSES